MAYTPTYTTGADGKPMAKVVKTDTVTLDIGGKKIQGYQTTYADGKSKWITTGDASNNSGYDYSTFTSQKNSSGKWIWTPTTADSISNLGDNTGISSKQIEKDLYTQAIQNSLDNNRVTQLGGTDNAKKIDNTIPTVGASATQQPAANQAGTQTPTDADITNAKTDIVSTHSGTRNDPNTYGNLYYPLKFKDNQDYINIIMLKYVPKPIGQNTTAGTPSPGENKDRVTLGSVRLPIPAGINDSNRVNWGDDSLQPLESALADLMNSGITGQNGGVGGAAERALNTVAKNSTDAKKLFTSKFVQSALGVNILKRNEGAITNPNMELLFDSPDIRSFSFIFRLSPRGEQEAVMVRKIIRFFKQGMSVQRSKSELFLKAPNTFQIKYCNGKDKEHPYLTKFKECALTDFSVNYTPDGSYMTYEGNEASMTAYEISMQFQELEPIFNDDYPNDGDATIGY